MSSLSDSFFRHVTGGMSPAGEDPSRIRQMIAGIESRTGSVRATAADIGVSESTVRRWKNGQATPKPENFRRVVEARRHHIAQPERMQAAMGPNAPNGGIQVEGWVTVSRDRRWRTIKLGASIDPARMQHAMDAWAMGDDDEFHATINDALTDYIQGAEGATIETDTAVIRW